MLDPTVRELAVKCCGIDPSAQFLVIKIDHSTMGIFRLQNNVAIDAVDLVDVSLRKDVTLKVNNHGLLLACRERLWHHKGVDRSVKASIHVKH
jgi:hypothetical protein